MAKASINLIKDQKGDLVERIINWSLTIGRALVIVTELIAFIAFLWRFGLDQQLVDLHTQIKQKEAIVSAFKKNEDEYRNLQDRLDIASSYSIIVDKRVAAFEDILGFPSEGVTINKIGLNQDAVVIEINVNSVSSLSDFVNTLKADSRVESVSIDKIETKTSSAVIVVGITITLKPLPNKYATKN
jgi:hypothetical protein